MSDLSPPGRVVTLEPPLSEALRHLYVIDVPPEAPTTVHHLPPSLEMMVVLNFGPAVTFSFGLEALGDRTVNRVAILGPLRQVMHYELRGGDRLLILPFVYNGFYRFLPIPPDKLDDLSGGEREAHDRRLAGLWQLLSPLPSSGARVDALIAHLLDTIDANDRAALPFLESVPEMHQLDLNSVSVIADKTSLTERSIQAQFKKYTGYTLKEQARFLRFKRVLYDVLNSGERKVVWLDLVVAHGYHDQSHLIKDFKHYTGLSPQRFVRFKDESGFCMNLERGAYESTEGPGDAG